MTVLHSDLIGADNHEVKGADTALAGQVLSADGAGNSVFVAPATLTTTTLSGVARGKLATTTAPAAEDTALDLTFGVQTSSSEVTVGAAGTLTIVNTGVYFISSDLMFGRTNSTTTAKILFRVLINGTQFGNTMYCSLNSSDLVIPYSRSFVRAFTAGDILKFQIVRESVGENDGGVIALVPTLAGVDTAHALWVTAHRLTGAL